MRNASLARAAFDATMSAAPARRRSGGHAFRIHRSDPPPRGHPHDPSQVRHRARALLRRAEKNPLRSCRGRPRAASAAGEHRSAARCADTGRMGKRDRPRRVERRARARHRATGERGTGPAVQGSPDIRLALSRQISDDGLHAVASREHVRVLSGGVYKTAHAPGTRRHKLFGGGARLPDTHPGPRHRRTGTPQPSAAAIAWASSFASNLAT